VFTEDLIQSSVYFLNKHPILFCCWNKKGTQHIQWFPAHGGYVTQVYGSQFPAQQARINIAAKMNTFNLSIARKKNLVSTAATNHGRVVPYSGGYPPPRGRRKLCQTPDEFKFFHSCRTQALAS
jgi:hypothetical protein